MQAPAVARVQPHVFPGNHVPVQIIGIHAHRRERKRADLLKAQVCVHVALHRGVDLREVCDLPGALQLVENGKEHALLPVGARHIGTALALAAVIEHSLPVKVLQAGVKGTPVHRDLDVHVIVHTTHGVYNILYGVHIHAHIIIDRDASKESAHGVERAFIAAALEPAAQ